MLTIERLEDRCLPSGVTGLHVIAVVQPRPPLLGGLDATWKPDPYAQAAEVRFLGAGGAVVADQLMSPTDNFAGIRAPVAVRAIEVRVLENGVWQPWEIAFPPHRVAPPVRGLPGRIL